MCGERDITFIDYTVAIDIERHSYEIKFIQTNPVQKNLPKIEARLITVVIYP